MLRIYLPLSLNLPTIVSDLPTVVSGFTYFRLRIYLPLQDEKSGAEKSGDEKAKDDGGGGDEVSCSQWAT